MLIIIVISDFINHSFFNKPGKTVFVFFVYFDTIKKTAIRKYLPNTYILSMLNLNPVITLQIYKLSFNLQTFYSFFLNKYKSSKLLKKKNRLDTSIRTVFNRAGGRCFFNRMFLWQ